MVERVGIMSCWGTGFLSRAIRFFTEGSVSHTAIYVRMDGVDYVMDSQRDGFNFRPMSVWLRKYGYSYKLYECGVVVLDRAMMFVGVSGYDFESLLLRFPLSIVWGKISGRKYVLKEDGDGRMVCSEVVGKCLGLGEIMSPSELDKWLSDNLKLEKVVYGTKS